MDGTKLLTRLPVSQPFLYGNEDAYVADALKSTFISGGGPYVDLMEQLISEAADTRHAVAVSNGTNALDLALKALNVAAGDEIIVPDFAMFSPISAVLRSGAHPVPVDADHSWNIDPEQIEAAITPKTCGIVMVHTYGHPANGVAIKRIAERHGLWLIEDAAEAMGGSQNGGRVGSFGTLATFSFYSNKVVTSGEGGAVVTNDAALNDRLRKLRNLSFGPKWETRFIHEAVGFNFRLSNVLAAIGCAQLENLDRAVSTKQDIAAKYLRRLAACDHVEFQPVSSDVDHTYWVVGMLLPRGVHRTTIAQALSVQGIETRPFFHPVHRQPCLSGLIQGHFPISDDIATRGIYVPSFVGMTDGMIDQVCTALKGAF